MSFRGHLADESSIYEVDDDGDLRWYRDDVGPNGELIWAPGSGTRISYGWDFPHVFAGGGGVIYVINGGGDLLWYRDDLRDGTNGRYAETGWATSTKIGWGWDFAHVCSAGDGVIYAITASGEVRWYHDQLRDGTNLTPDGGLVGWDLRGGTPIGVGWVFHLVFPGTGGVVYGLRANGELVWHRDDARDGTNSADGSTGWAPGSGRTTRVVKGEVTSAFVRGGFLYLVMADGRLVRTPDPGPASEDDDAPMPTLLRNDETGGEIEEAAVEELSWPPDP